MLALPVNVNQKFADAFQSVQRHRAPIHAADVAPFEVNFARDDE